MSWMRSPGILPLRRRLALWFLIATLGAWIGLLPLALPEMRALSQLRQQHDERQALEMRQQSALQRALKAERDADEPASWRQLPASADIGALSSTLAAIAARHDINLRQIAPGDPVRTASYQQHPLRLKLNGDYPKLLRFIHHLGAVSAPLTIAGLEVTAIGAPLDLARAPELGVNLLLRSYCCAADSSARTTTAPDARTPPETDSWPPLPALPPLPPLPSPSSSAPTDADADETNKTAKTLDADADADARTEALSVRFAAAENVAAMLEQVFPQAGLAFSVDKRTNTVLLYGGEAARARAKRAVKLLDVPVRQVMIEAMIVISRLSDASELGINWSIDADATPSARAESLNSELGSTLKAALQLGFVHDHALLKLELEAMQNRGEGEIVSRPRLVTGNRQSASIKSGTRIPFQESAPNGRTTVRFQDAVLRLDVVPIILPNDKIHLQLVINQDAPGAAVEVGGGAAPTIDTTELRTQVLLSEGQTVALGGVFRHEDKFGERQTPVLGALPLVGGLFRHNSRSRSKTETMIFITPYILPGE